MNGRWLGALAALLLVAAACGDDAGSGGDDGAAFMEVVEASLEAENAQDADAFLALWTDSGLEEYDVGTREEVAASDNESFGEDKILVVRKGEPVIDGDTARVELDGTTGEKSFVTPLHRVVFKGVKEGGEWKLNGFEYLGSPPPGEDAEVVEITARDYEFHLDRDSVPAGEVAFRFVNDGKEQHEISLYKGPDGVTVEDAKAALENVDGSELTDIPDGYEVTHVSFAEPGDEADVTFVDPIEAGTYVLACYIPQGGFGEDGPVNPEGRPHIQLGMVHLLTVS